MVQDHTPERLGPYRLLRRLGEGGMGVVHLASDAAGQLVAVKALRPGLAADPTARRRLTREVEAMRRVRSPNVAEVLTADLDGDVPFIVTRYVPGQTLDAVVSETGPLTADALARVVRGLAAALTAVHAAGIVHRDLKPGNVMIAAGEPVLIDFGIAQMPGATRLTMTGMFMGTPGFLAPEVIEGMVSGPASDVHSWGATVAFAATGRPPYGSGSFESIFYRIMHGQPDLDTLPVPLRPLVGPALMRAPEARPSAAELCELAAGLDPDRLIPGPAAGGPGADGLLRVTAGLAGADGRGPAEPGAGGLAGAAALAAAGGLAGAAGVAGGAGVAGAAGVAGGGGLAGAAGRAGSSPTMADPAALRSPFGSTRPLASASPADVRDLLPPVSWPGQAGNAGHSGRPHAPAPPAQPGRQGQADDAWQPWPAAQAGPGGPAAPDRARGRGARGSSAVSSWSPLVIGTVAVAVAIAVLFPLAGTALMIAAFLALQAADRTGRRLAGRPGGIARRATSRIRAVVYFPVAVLRSGLHVLLVAPVAILAFGIAAALTVVVLPVHPLPTAVSVGAGALVAAAGLGPGSAGVRNTLARIFGMAAVRPERTAALYVGIAALAIGSAVAAFSQAATYWPVTNVHALLLRLPAVHSLLHYALLSLTAIARRNGL